MTDVWFYHLERQSLEQVLPVLLDRALARGWRAAVQATAPERIEALDNLLWTWTDESFLAHGSTRDGDEAMHPIWLTTGPDNPNAAAMRVFVDGASPGDVLANSASAPSERAVVLFDGRDEASLGVARSQFRDLRTAGHALSYWRQSSDGRWEKQT